MSESNNDNKGQHDQRRKVLKSIVAGGGAITAASTTDKWAKPAVEALILPAHAQTSPDPSPFDPFGNFTSGTIVVNNFVDSDTELLAADETISEELLEFFLPSANAQSVCSGNCSVQIDATIDSSNADLCVSGDFFAFDQVGVKDSVDPPVFTETASLPPLSVISGEFDSSTGDWNLTVLDSFNLSSDVTLSPGGSGCFPE